MLLCSHGHIHRSAETAAAVTSARSPPAAPSAVATSSTSSFASVAPPDRAPVVAPSATTQQALETWAAVQAALPAAAAGAPAVSASPTNVHNYNATIDPYVPNVTTWYVIFVGRRVGIFSSA